MAFSHLWSTPCNFTFWPAERTDFRLFYSWNPIHRHQCIILWLFFLLPKPFGDRFVGSCRVFYFWIAIKVLASSIHLQVFTQMSMWSMWSIISHSEAMRGKKLNLPICLTRAALIVLFRISACFSTVSFIGSSRCIKTCYCCLWFNRKGFLRHISSR